jgi:hypothetical protein
MILQHPKRYQYPSPANAVSMKRMALLFIKGSPEPTSEEYNAYGDQLWQGDEFADDVADWYRQTGMVKARQQLEHILENPSEINNSPEVLQRFLSTQLKQPEWLDESQLELGAATCRRIGMFGNWVMRDMALMGGYQSSAINKPLIFTGALESGTDRRLAETRKFWIDVTQPNALLAKNVGFKTSTHVRIMHSLIRRGIMNKEGWSNEEWGVPINQADMVVTNLSFSIVFLLGLRSMGFSFSKKEAEAVLHLWRYVGHLLGINADLLPVTEQQGRRLLYLATLTQPGSDDDSRLLAMALRDQPLQQNKWRWVARLKIQMHSGFSRFFLDKQAADDLVLPNNLWRLWPALVIPIIFCVERSRIIMPGATKLAEKFGGWWQRSGVDKHLAGKQAEFKIER